MRLDYESVRALYALWSYEYILFFFFSFSCDIGLLRFSFESTIVFSLLNLKRICSGKLDLTTTDFSMLIFCPVVGFGVCVRHRIKRNSAKETIACHE